jgi:replication factor C small subunit
MAKRLWVDKYRPTTLDTIIFKRESLRTKFQEYLDDKSIPNLLFSGVQGSGKTTTALALIDALNINEYDYLKINASNKNGVEIVRDVIDPFSQSMPLGDFKIIHLEEFDRFSAPAQDMMRKIMEEPSDTCRFIATCNHINKIIPALRSRFQEYVFSSPDFDQVLIYAAEILEKEQVEYNLDLLEKYVTSVYPDIRKVVQLLEQYTVKGKLIAPDSTVNNIDYKFKLLEFIESSDFTSLRKVISENIQPEDFEDVYEFLYKNIHKCPKFNTQDKEESAIVMIADRLYKHSFFAHPHINLSALFIDLGNLS